MNYELAKELKEAGFPQKDGLKFIDENTIWDATAQSEFETPRTHSRSSWVKCPTLSELIEACGFDFRDLSQHSPTEHRRVRWIAKGGKGKFGHWKLINGDTPEEAVARLWLALNKK